MGFYRSVARPLLFALPPETSHSFAARFLEWPLPWAALSGGSPVPLPTDLAGIALDNPVGMAAGFDKNGRMVSALSSIGFGYVVVGTVTREARTGNQKPRIVRTRADRSITNSMGIPNEGVERIAGRLDGHPGTAPVLASLADEEPEDVLRVFERLEPVVAGFELNVSSPNSPWRHSGRDNAAHLQALLGGLPRTKPLFVKLPPFEPGSSEAEDALGLARIAADAGVDGLTAGNTVPVTEPRLAKGSGGVSGGPLTERTPRMIEALRAACPGLVLNACGGIFTPEDAGRSLDAGATTVQLYTAFIYEGPGVVGRITSGLAAARAPVEDGRER